MIITIHKGNKLFKYWKLTIKINKRLRDEEGKKDKEFFTGVVAKYIITIASTR